MASKYNMKFKDIEGAYFVNNKVRTFYRSVEINPELVVQLKLKDKMLTVPEAALRKAVEYAESAKLKYEVTQ